MCVKRAGANAPKREANPGRICRLFECHIWGGRGTAVLQATSLPIGLKSPCPLILGLLPMAGTLLHTRGDELVTILEQCHPSHPCSETLRISSGQGAAPRAAGFVPTRISLVVTVRASSTVGHGGITGYVD